MTEPLRHMPLALCDPNSVAPEDVIVADIVGIAPQRRVTRQAVLRYNPA